MFIHAGRQDRPLGWCVLQIYRNCGLILPEACDKTQYLGYTKTAWHISMLLGWYYKEMTERQRFGMIPLSMKMVSILGYIHEVSTKCFRSIFYHCFVCVCVLNSGVVITWMREGNSHFHLLKILIQLTSQACLTALEFSPIKPWK